VIKDEKRLSEIEKEQEKLRNAKLKRNPEEVSSTSSVRGILDEAVPPTEHRATNYGDEPDMLAGVKSDLKTVTETFDLSGVPREVYWFGLGGLVPYVTTSMATLYLAWDTNYAAANGVGYMVSAETAEHLLHILEPMQVGLGAIILSFLGAVHWGLEMAQYGGSHPYRRYTIGILAPVLAWPTVLLPLDYALLAQFAGFTGMYFADAQATTWGWAPKWYTTYRFVLTFIVGASIVATLVGRGQIGDSITPQENARNHLKAIRDTQWENLQKEEDERKKHVRESKARAKEEEERKAAEEAKKNDESKGEKKAKDDDKKEGDDEEKTEKD